MDAFEEKSGSVSLPESVSNRKRGIAWTAPEKVDADTE
jgi:hypothetical protein